MSSAGPGAAAMSLGTQPVRPTSEPPAPTPRPPVPPVPSANIFAQQHIELKVMKIVTTSVTLTIKGFQPALNQRGGLIGPKRERKSHHGVHTSMTMNTALLEDDAASERFDVEFKNTLINYRGRKPTRTTNRRNDLDTVQ
ncbi:hypothetical protein EVAR_67743_1 [Eumeta japonica]|uniref:Uncharacterized protein n=1 Tax=Eumeta variegata TaxID=151549 RepID=A0A4C1ZAG5_EUMVA|nr:hypothetical protein EVAR_67743_1 [Eumeta japonica]